MTKKNNQTEALSRLYKNYLWHCIHLIVRIYSNTALYIFNFSWLGTHHGPAAVWRSISYSQNPYWNYGFKQILKAANHSSNDIRALMAGNWTSSNWRNQKSRWFGITTVSSDRQWHKLPCKYRRMNPILGWFNRWIT